MATIEQKIEALRLAREYVALGGEFVCNMLDVVAQDYQYLADACEQLRKYCSKAVATGECETLDEWIFHQGYDVYGDPDKPARMIATRLAWIDWMIACYEEDLRKQRRYDNDDAFALCG